MASMGSGLASSGSGTVLSGGQRYRSVSLGQLGTMGFVRSHTGGHTDMFIYTPTHTSENLAIYSPHASLFVVDGGASPMLVQNIHITIGERHWYPTSGAWRPGADGLFEFDTRDMPASWSLGVQAEAMMLLSQMPQSLLSARGRGLAAAGGSTAYVPPHRRGGQGGALRVDPFVYRRLHPPDMDKPWR